MARLGERPGLLTHLAQIVEASTGGVRVAVTSAQARFLPAFFKAVREANLAARQNGTRLERECSISHTTLAQVFLKVCQANNDVAIEVSWDGCSASEQGESTRLAVQVVAADNRADDDRAVMEQRCVLCRLRDRERATLYTLDRVPVKVDDLVCVKCATGQHDGDPVLDDRVGNVVAPSPTSPPTPAVPLDVPAPEPARYEPVNDAALGTSVRAVILSQVRVVSCATSAADARPPHRSTPCSTRTCASLGIVVGRTAAWRSSCSYRSP